MLLTWHNIQYYQDLMRGIRGGDRRGPAGGARRRDARRLGGGGHTMTDGYDDLTQLGQPTRIPASPAEAKLERVANPRPDAQYLVRFTCRSSPRSVR